MSGNHTPGEWRVTDQCDDWKTDEHLVVSDVQIDGETVSVQIAGVYEFDSQNPNAPRARSASANARLISASPNLLSSLSMLADAADSHIELCDEVEAARAAIAKATTP